MGYTHRKRGNIVVIIRDLKYRGLINLPVLIAFRAIVMVSRVVVLCRGVMLTDAEPLGRTLRAV
jgi:hypothetical protein